MRITSGTLLPAQDAYALSRALVGLPRTAVPVSPIVQALLTRIDLGRRLYINTPWRQQVFPNLYVMVVAVSTYYRKSAGLSLASEVARAAMPHMILPQPGSPENFMSMLGGVLPTNFETIPAPDRERL